MVPGSQRGWYSSSLDDNILVFSEYSPVSFAHFFKSFIFIILFWPELKQLVSSLYGVAGINFFFIFLVRGRRRARRRFGRRRPCLIFFSFLFFSLLFFFFSLFFSYLFLLFIVLLHQFCIVYQFLFLFCQIKSCFCPATKKQIFLHLVNVNWIIVFACIIYRVPIKIKLVPKLVLRLYLPSLWLL